MWEEIKERLNLKENYLSLGIGALVVILVGAAIFNSITGRNGAVSENGQQTEQEQEATESGQMAELPTQYTVQEGEDLWTISEKFYGSGYNWVDIVEENEIRNPDRVEAGTELTIPEVTPRPTQEQARMETYTVKAGDTLFLIAEKVYGDGYQWAKIARENNLRNPNLIEKGQQLTIPK